MNIYGIVSEFNPFHYGHKYILEEINKFPQEKLVIAVLSSSFVQRGEAAILSKWDRAKICLEYGVDLVLELPFVFACQNAEIFAKGAINILNQGGINYLFFGAETANAQLLNNLADKIDIENKNLDLTIKKHLSQGMSFIRARNAAFIDTKILNEEEIATLSNPNNILAIEYIKALKYYRANINLVPIARKNVEHDSNLIKNSFTSASKIRNDFFNKKDIKNLLPYNMSQVNFHTPNYDLLLNLIKYKFLIEKIDLSNNIEYEIGLENRVKKSLHQAQSFEDLAAIISNKRITKARTRRLLLNSLLYVEKSTILEAIESSKYLRVLAMNKKGMLYLKNLNKAYVQKFKDFNNFDKITKRISEIESDASNLYSMLTNQQMNLDFTTSPIIKNG